jgi:DNA-directed RNA polymerase specialized sigma subunit
MAHNDSDETFRSFAGTLTDRIKAQQKLDGLLTEAQLLEKQCKQFQELTALENEFRDAMGPEVYEAFIAKICDENGNILTSRPFFRERQEVCIGPISQALKRRDVGGLVGYHINYNFISFALGCKAWSPKMKALGKRIERARENIIVTNMPLAISQARIFWGKAPAKTQDQRFTFMDFVQVAADGLMSAVDKFVLPPDLGANPAAIRVWRAVAIGRIKGNAIEMFSETTIHFFPQDKRKLYRANKHMKDFGGRVDFEALSSRVNTDLGPDGPKTNPAELASLMGAAANTIQSGNEDDEDPSDTPLTRAAATSDWQPDTRAEKSQTMSMLSFGLRGLSVYEQKLIKMQGIGTDLL